MAKCSLKFTFYQRDSFTTDQFRLVVFYLKSVNLLFCSVYMIFKYRRLSIELDYFSDRIEKHIFAPT